MADYIPDILALLPQGPPFILVDRWLGSDGLVARAGFLVTAGHPLVENNRLGVAGLIENIAQTAAAGAGMEAQKTGQGPRGGAIVSINRLEIHGLPTIGDELVTQTVVTARVGDIVVISAKVTRGQSTLAAAELKILTGV